jgi:ketosteroid isomerase-like protein
MLGIHVAPVRRRQSVAVTAAIASALLLFLSPVASAQGSATGARGRAQGSSSAAERELRRLEDEWGRAVIQRDAALFRRLIAPTMVYSDERGVFTREQVIAENTTGADTVESATNEDMHVHLYGNTAVVTGVLVMKGHGPDGRFERRYRFTDTWLRRNGRWQVIAAQDYLIPRS